MVLAPHDPDFDPAKPAEAVLSIDAICVNRDLPTDLPFGGGHPRLRLVEGAAAVAALNAVTAATPTLRPPLREAGFWRLVSHLSLGHLSVTGGTEGARALKEVLRLYDLRDTAETRTGIEALTAISAGPGTARAPAAPADFAAAWTSTWSSIRAPGRPAGSICLPPCWNASLHCTAPSTASPAPASRCAAVPAPPPPGRPAAAPVCSHDAGQKGPGGFAPCTPTRAGGPGTHPVFAEGGGPVGAACTSGAARPLQRKPRIGMQGPPALAGGAGGGAPLAFLPP